MNIFILLFCTAFSVFSCSKDDNYEDYDEITSDIQPVIGETPIWVEAIDLGLPSGTLWANCNIGATSPTEYGAYFAWGETTPKKFYSPSNSITYGKSISELKSRNIIDDNKILTKKHDAASKYWGKHWRTPTIDDIEELLNSSNCTWEWTIQNGINGRKITSNKNGNSIFLPASGLINDETLGYVGTYGYSWSSTADDYEYSSRYLFFNSEESGSENYSYRYLGRCIRPVLK